VGALITAYPVQYCTG